MPAGHRESAGTQHLLEVEANVAGAASEGVTPGQSGGFVKLLVAVKLQRSLILQLQVLHIQCTGA